MKADRLAAVAPALVFALSLVVYVWQASQTPLLNAQRDAQDRYLLSVAQSGNASEATDPTAASAYWTRYPDVAADPYYGLKGPLGLGGALQHYRDHGRREGRIWGP